MDQATLVEHQIDDVPRLIDQLERDKIDVKAAFWLYTSEADQWFLYLVSDVVDRKGITEAYKLVYKAMRRLTNLSINRFEVKLVSPGNPVAKAVIDFLSRQHAPLATWVRGTNLGDVYIENAYIYNISRPAYGHMKTGKVVSARQIGTTADGDSLFEPDIQGSADLNDWVPGVLGSDGKFHPSDQTRKPPSGEWTV